MGGTSSDDDDQDTGILLQDEVSGAIRAVARRAPKQPDRDREVGAIPVRTRSDRDWREASLQDTSTVVRRLDPNDTLRAGFDELPRPRSSVSRPVVVPGRRVAGGAPTVARVPVAEVVLEPSLTDEERSAKPARQGRSPRGEDPPKRRDETAQDSLSRDLRPEATDPGWLAVQASLAGLLVSAAMGLSVLVGFVLLR